MPKPVLILFAVTVLALAACGGNTSATPTPAPIVSPTVDPNIKTAMVSVTFQGNPRGKIPVLISTPKSSANPRPGTPFAEQTTQPIPAKSPGVATFKKLTPGTTYCWVATIPYKSPSPPPTPTPTPTASAVALGTTPRVQGSPSPTPSPIVATNCTSGWQFSTVPLGN